jgi:hypothetical protein
MRLLSELRHVFETAAAMRANLLSGAKPWPRRCPSAGERSFSSAQIGGTALAEKKPPDP